MQWIYALGASHISCDENEFVHFLYFLPWAPFDRSHSLMVTPFPGPPPTSPTSPTSQSSPFWFVFLQCEDSFVMICQDTIEDHINLINVPIEEKRKSLKLRSNLSINLCWEQIATQVIFTHPLLHQTLCYYSTHPGASCNYLVWPFHVTNKCDHSDSRDEEALCTDDSTPSSCPPMSSCVTNVMRLRRTCACTDRTLSSCHHSPHVLLCHRTQYTY